MSQLTAICDAITNDLLAGGTLNPPLQPATTVKYAPPRAPSGLDLPLLAVYAGQPAVTHELETTVPGPFPNPGESGYLRTYLVVVEWWVQNGEGAETGGVTDQQTVADLTGFFDPVLNHLETYAGGLPGGPATTTVATVENTSYEPSEGDEYVAHVTLAVRL